MFFIGLRLGEADKGPAKIKLFVELSFEEQFAVATDHLTIIFPFNASFSMVYKLILCAERKSYHTQQKRIQSPVKHLG